MSPAKPKVPIKGAGSRLRELSVKRREEMKPTKALVDILKTPALLNHHGR